MTPRSTREVVWESEPSPATTAAVRSSPPWTGTRSSSSRRSRTGIERYAPPPWAAAWSGRRLSAGAILPTTAPIPATSGLVAGQLGGDEVVAFTTESGSLIVLNPADGTERLAVDLGGPAGSGQRSVTSTAMATPRSPRSRPTDESEPSTPPARRCSRQTSTRAGESSAAGRRLRR